MFTIFHLLQLIGLIIGLYVGFQVGFFNFGWLETFGSTFLGGVCGLIIGKVPFWLGFLYLRHDLRNCDTETLKQRLKKEIYIPHLISDELERRGETFKKPPQTL